MGVGLPRIYIVDEHDRVRRALADRLRRAHAVRVVGDSGEASAAVEAVRGGIADVVLVEVKRSDGLGLELVRQLAALPVSPRVMVLTSYPTEWEERAVRRAGASDYLVKELELEQLVARIREPGE
jgi:two-component system response regulator DevR